MDVTPPTPPDGLQRAVRWMLIVAFVGAICAPALKTALHPHGPEVIVKENRKPAPRPGVPRTADDWRAFPTDFEVWFDDFFGFRTQLIRWHNIVKLLVFRVSPGDRVDLGKQGWMFIGSADYRASHRATHPFSEVQLRNWRVVLEQHRDWVESLGGRYVFFVAPNKATIYPELLPEELYRVGETTRLDQLTAYLAEHSDVAVLDLRPSLLAAKGERELYDPLGTHWNQLGAYRAKLDLLGRLQEWYPKLQPLPWERYREVGRPLSESWALRFHMEDIDPRGTIKLQREGPPRIKKETFRGERQVVIRYVRDRPGMHAVFLRDSFANALAPLLAPYFGTLDLIWSQTEDPAWTRAFIEEHRPEVVIEEVVERSLISTRAPFLRRGWNRH